MSQTGTALAVLMSVAVLAAAACGSSSSGASDASDRAAIKQAADHYFVLDRTSNADDYCTSYIELQRSDSFRHGNLTSDANRTETRCRQFLPRYARHVGHTGWPDAHIKRVEIDGSRGHVLVSYRMGERRVSRDAWVGKVARGDWRVLNAGYD